MPRDAFIKFGSTNPVTVGGPKDTPLPLLEGDSEDRDHFYWCEMREDGAFSVERSEESGADAASTEPRSEFAPVTIRKKVDWSTTQLFQRCCLAHNAKLSDPVPTSGSNFWLDQIIIHICRPTQANADKLPFITLTYTDVRITNFAVAMQGSDVEPTETITFEFKKFTFEYQPMDPVSGCVSGDVQAARELPNGKAKADQRTRPPGQGTPAPAAGGGNTSTGSSGNGSAAAPAPPQAPVSVTSVFGSGSPDAAPS